MNIEEVRQITVIGAGQMGHQIAMLCALGGFQTVLQDVEASALEKADAQLHSLMHRWTAKGKLSEEQSAAAFKRLSFSNSLEQSVEHSDFIIEAIVEKLDAKQHLFSELERLAPAHAVFATNSSTIVNSLIADVTARPDRVVNMHFFFPPLVMDCVEVVMSDKTSQDTADLTMAIAQQINRTAVLLKKEISGFVANRILGALQKEAVSLYEQGIADYRDIDTICKKALNHPIGPFELMDLSGIDVGYYVMEQRYAETGNEEDRPAACIREKVEQGHLGRKTGKGWYTYEKEGARH